MKKQMLLAIVLFMPAFSRPMEAYDRCAPHIWRTRKLRFLLEESQWSTCTMHNSTIRVLKFIFVQKYLEKYQDQQSMIE
ncbi:hypothetical protein BH09DEP1_BH09DEP1_0290 [soil metagenome]